MLDVIDVDTARTIVNSDAATRGPNDDIAGTIFNCNIAITIKLRIAVLSSQSIGSS